MPVQITGGSTDPNQGSSKKKRASSSGGGGSSRVAAYQRQLQAAGYYHGRIDGINGPLTRSAVMSYQRAHGLTVDGSVGPQTLAALNGRSTGGGGGSSSSGGGSGGGGGGTSKHKATASAPKINRQVLAEQYGYSYALLNSNHELKSVFNKAVAGTWSADRFVAAIRNTQWYKKHSETWRNAMVQKAEDPKSYNQSVDQQRSRVQIAAGQMGARVSGGTLDHLARAAYQYGWDDNQLQQHLAGYVKATDGRLYGQAGQWQTELRGWAQQMGVPVSEKTIEHWVSNLSRGTITEEDAKKSITETAASAYPQLADRLRAGETVESIADPYKQTMAQILEVNPESITLKDRTVKSALQARDSNGKPTLMSLYDFEDKLRQDPRWAKTDNAKDAAATQVHSLLQDWGLQS